MPKRGLIKTHSSTLEVLYRLFDAVLVVTSFIFAGWFYDYPWNPHFSFFAALAVIVFYITARQSGLYQSWRTSSIGHESGVVFQSWFLTILMVMVIAFLSKFTGPFFRRVLVAWFATGLFLLVSLRFSLRFILRMARRKGMNLRTVVIGGAGVLGVRLADVTMQNDWMGFKLLGFYDDMKSKDQRPASHTDASVRGTLDDMVDDVRKEHIDFVYLALPMRAENRMRDVLKKLADTTASVYIVPDIFTFELLNARLIDMNGIPTVSIYEGPYYGINDWIKRLEDLAVGIIITISIIPIIIIVAVGIKLTSPGPIIFKQKRYGFNGEEIMVWKFRTMTVCEDGPEIPQARKNDPRVTKLGEFLRKTSLDELPQFFNVLQGRMSIVGPRPHAVAHNEYYRALIPGYMLRHKVKPGITGWAQVNGWRGETETVEKMKKRVDFDLEYIRNWSLWLDLKIIFMTIIRGFSGKNAY